MPTYAYRCKSCGHEVEYFQSMSEGRKRKCPACGRSSLERLIGAGAGIIFKGSGFYETDYRSESYSKAAEAEGSGAAAASDGPKAGASNEPTKPSAAPEGRSAGRGSKSAGSKGPGSKGPGSKGSGSRSSGRTSKGSGSSGAAASDA